MIGDTNNGQNLNQDCIHVIITINYFVIIITNTAIKYNICRIIIQNKSKELTVGRKIRVHKIGGKVYFELRIYTHHCEQKLAAALQQQARA
jgi:hypothetical protein